MKTLHQLQLFFLTFVISSVLLMNCSNREETVSCFPETNIDVQINLNLPLYQPLQTIGGWAYINEQESGTKGLIVVNTTSGYLAFDRNAPHICPDNDTQLIVENGNKIVCPKDNAAWILITGQPIAVSPIAPKKYYVYYNSSNLSLTITN